MSELLPLRDYVMDTDISALDGVFGYAGTAYDEDDKLVDVFIPIDFMQALEYLGMWKRPNVN